MRNTLNEAKTLRSFLAALCLLLSVLVQTDFAQPQGPRGPSGTIPGTLETALKLMGSIRNAEERIQRKWDELGGAPGQPTLADSKGINITTGGYFREYVNNGRIYYRPSDTRPFFVYGYILDKYRQLGGASSRLGWPTSDEQPFTEGGRVTTFEGGAIYWWPDTGAIEVTNVVVRYKGLYCFGETDEPSASDEPYLIFAAIPTPPAAASTLRTSIYEDTDSGESSVDNIELYRGLPYGLSLDVVLMEHDDGNPDKERALVKMGADEAAKKLAEASANIPKVGPVVAVGLALLWEAVGQDVVDAINDILDFQDNRLDAKHLQISGRQMVTLARNAARHNLKGIEWQFETPLMSGEGGSYKAYFVIEAVEAPIQAVAEVRIPGTPSPAKGGRVTSPTGVSNPSLSKCQAAAMARARNSPAAPGLTEQCLAIVNDLAIRGQAMAKQDPVASALRSRQPDTLAQRGFDIGLAVAEQDTADGPGKQAIRDSLKPAEQLGFSDGVTFALGRNRIKQQESNAALAEKGEAIANQDPLAVALRNLQPEGSTRRGFDIGMAAAEGDTAPGPGKQRIHDSLLPAEQQGFTTAVSFSLARNKNAKLAATGATIAESDSLVAEARDADRNPFYQLGFDIATGLFGDPAKGAQGNTLLGPGSLGIRNGLDTAGKRGFDAAVKFHLARKYR